MGNPDEVLAKSWSDEVTRLMLETDALWMAFVKNFTDIDPNVTLHLRYKRFLRTITDYTGRERSLIGQLIAERMYPTPETVAELQRGQGIVALSLADQPRTCRPRSPLSHHRFRFRGRAQSPFHDVRHRSGLSWMSHRRGPFAIYPISLDLWFELSTQASDSFAALRDASIRATRDHIDRLIAGTQRSIAAAALVFILALAPLRLQFLDHLPARHPSHQSGHRCAVESDARRRGLVRDLRPRSRRNRKARRRAACLPTEHGGGQTRRPPS